MGAYPRNVPDQAVSQPMEIGDNAVSGDKPTTIGQINFAPRKELEGKIVPINRDVLKTLKDFIKQFERGEIADAIIIYDESNNKNLYTI